MCQNSGIKQRKIMETPTNQKSDLETIGVSRSGRVRKKSSKLVDFQSPDDIEPKTKKAALNKTLIHNKNLSIGRLSSPPPQLDEDELIDDDNDSITDDDLDDIELDEEILEDDDENGLDTVRQSLYMSEKSNKKKVLKDGKIVYGKSQRKDKGKTRLTAYMLWARDARKSVLKQNSESDFANVSRRLGELWANVPANEKANWRRRAKRLAVKTKKAETKQQSPIKTISPSTTTPFLNRATTSRTKKLSQSSEKKSPKEEITSIEANSFFETSPLRIDQQNIQPGVYRVTGIEPLDAGAHLKLLGDSLTIIGDRLKEHEGQITVSGSLSVLLDSLLCSLGPLMCLTTQIPGLVENDKILKDNLHKTLDNIAYVMPGL